MGFVYESMFYKKATHSYYSDSTRILKTFSEFFSHITDWQINKQEFDVLLRIAKEFLPDWKVCSAR